MNKLGTKKCLKIDKNLEIKLLKCLTFALNFYLNGPFSEETKKLILGIRMRQLFLVGLS